MLKIETWLEGIGLKQPIEECPAWPPDLYALTGALIRRSGGYLELFRGRSADYLSGVVPVANRWREKIDEIQVETVTVQDLQSVRVSEVIEGWAVLMGARKTLISEIRLSRELSQCLIRLALIADEASAGIGIGIERETGGGGIQRSKFLAIADAVLYGKGLQSFCWDVPQDTLCVLGKQHTPSKGATFRSLSHHLALYHPNEIEARWINPFPMTGRTPSKRTLNLLLLPWPTRVDAEDFRYLPAGHTRTDESAPPGYFRYEPKSNQTDVSFEERLNRAISMALRHTGTIDAIVFPELSLTEKDYYIAERIAFQSRSILVCGLRQAGATPEDWDANLSVLQAAGAFRGPEEPPNFDDPLLSGLRFAQPKHHRWFLDRSQLVTYQLGGYFSELQGCWEHIDLPPRTLNFVTLNGMTWTVLVCEDLARQDPAADLIRAVGPNLLIALLMDGPQLSGRWPARYASVLADDPGSSVLTLTSLGMAQRSRPILQSGKREPPSTVIALWRDAVHGEVQIALDLEDDACVLSLESQMRTEYCADGRDDGGQTLYPVFAGYRSFRTKA